MKKHPEGSRNHPRVGLLTFFRGAYNILLTETRRPGRARASRRSVEVNKTLILSGHLSITTLK